MQPTALAQARAGVVLGVLAGALPGGSWVLWSACRPLLTVADATLADLLAGACAAGALAAWTWLGAGTVACTLTALRGNPLPTRWLPRAVPVLVVAAIGMAGGAAPALARDSHPLLTELDGLRVPDRVVARPGPPAPPASAGPAGPAGTVWTVRPGDCLWSLAEDHLGEAAPAALVDRTWRAVYRANRAAIGGDPDLLRPGTRLTLPTAPPPGVPARPSPRPAGDHS